MPVLIPRGAEPDPEEFRRFSCDVASDNPDTPDRVEPHVLVEREVYNSLDLAMPDGEKVRVWGFKSPGGGEQFPSEPIRVREGQIVHVRLKPSMSVHTIHHHGIEPSVANDGVGHTSFEVSGEYVYQWYARYAGHYAYHCHVNTVLHFEMGMYGPLIVDPPQGPGFVRRAGQVVPYDVEATWAADELDPRWRDLGHHAGIRCDNGEDAGLDRFEPRYFVLTGVPSDGRASSATRTDPRVATSARVGQTVLLRLHNVGYTIQQFTLEGLDAEVVEADGRTLGHPVHSPYSRPYVVPAGTPLELVTAQRRELLVRPTREGEYRATVRYLHWITRELLHTAETFVRVTR